MRPTKGLVGVLVVLTIVASGLGFLLGQEWSPTASSVNQTIAENNPKNKTDLTGEALLIEKSIRQNLERVRDHALQLLKLGEENPETDLSPSIEPKLFVHWMTFDWTDGELKTIVRAARQADWLASVDPDFTKGYVRFVRSQSKNFGNVSAQKPILLRIQSDSSRLNQWLSLGFLDSTGNRMTFVLVSADQLFDLRLPTGDRAFVITADGAILNHSQASYRGVQIQKTDYFTRTLYPELIGNTEPQTRQVRSIDQTEVHTTAVRLANLPLALVIERPLTTTASSKEKIGTSQASKLRLFGLGLMGLGLFLAIFLWVRRLTTESKVEIKTDSLPIERATLKLEQAQRARPSLQAPAVSLARTGGLKTAALDIEQEFSQSMASPLSPHLLLDTLAAQLSTLAESPVIILTYDANSSLLVLSLAQGFLDQTQPQSFALSISQEAVEQVVGFGGEAKVASLAKYPPLQKVMLEKLQVAHFEAWAIVTPAPRQYLIGVAVITQAGVATYHNRDSLMRMVRRAGEAYSNFLPPTTPLSPLDRTGFHGSSF